MSRKYHTKIYWLLVHYSGQAQYGVIWWVNYSAGLKCPQASTMTRTRTRLGTSTIHVVGLWPQASLWCPPHPTPLRTKTNLTLTLFAADIRGVFKYCLADFLHQRGTPPHRASFFGLKELADSPPPSFPDKFHPQGLKIKDYAISTTFPQTIENYILLRPLSVQEKPSTIISWLLTSKDSHNEFFKKLIHSR